MIPYASCMCFREERNSSRGKRAWKIITAQRDISLAIGGDESFYKRYQSDDEEGTSSLLSGSEICMLENVKLGERFALACAEQEVRVIGRRSRQPVITRIIDLSLLDDTYAGVTKILLSRCNSWSFNTFNLDVSTGGRSLSYLLVHLFQEYGFVSHFQLDIVKVWHCFNLMEAAYHRHNPYHNSVHAADVTQAMHCFLQENKFSAHLTPLEAMSSVIAAVAHDLDHPGVTQAFLVATSNHLVNLYNNSSVLENHHWRTAISCLKESGIFSHLDKEIWLDIQTQIRSLILATDITRQKEFLARFKDYLSSDSLDMEDSQYRHFALQIALKCADLCNPCRPWTISQRWSYQVCQEFYRQGAYERQLNLPLTPTFDCSRTKVAKIQADFFQFVVSPLFETWDHFLKTPLSNMLLENLKHNFNQWQQRITQQVGEVEMKTEIPQITVETTSEAQLSLEKDEKGNEQLLGADSDIILKQHRSKSDSGLTPRLLSPKIHMETYSTEELHPSTTLLSLSSITNTVQLRQVYAATKVESHLICPTVFQPLTNSTVTNETTITVECPSPVQDCDEDSCSTTVTESNVNNTSAQSCVDSSCPNGCGTPTTPEKSPPQIHRTKQRSQSLVHDSENIKHYSQVLQNRRASDFGFQLCNKLRTAQDSVKMSSCDEILTAMPLDCENKMPSFSNDNTANEQFCNSSKTAEIRSFTSSKMCSNKHCSSATCICELESDKKTPSWCWHISRSFSAERPVRPTHDFDSPLPSGPGSVSSLNYKGYNGRRGSAPVTFSHYNEIGASHSSSSTDRETRGGLRGGSEANGASGRRWSIPMEISGSPVVHPPANISETNSSTTINTRRSSFGLLEPLLSVSTLDTESPLKQGSPSLKPIHPSYHTFSNHKQTQKNELNEYRDGKPVTSSDSYLTFLLSPRPSPGQRRGSLPTDLYHSGEKLPISESSQASDQTGYLLEHARKHSSPSDLLSVLIGPSGVLNTMQGIVSGPTICQMPCSVSQECSRRRSGGLEMLSGLWKSRTNDAGVGLGMTNKLTLRKQLLEAWSSWRTGESNISPTVDTNAEISAFSHQLIYQQRRGSVPLTISLLSLSSGK